MRYRTTVVAVAAACVVQFGAAAHHSLAVYSNDVVELEGEITAVVWANPHVIVELRTLRSADAKAETWRIVRRNRGAVYAE